MLSATAQCALRVLALLARCPSGRGVSRESFAAAASVPTRDLGEIFRVLEEARIVRQRSQRGFGYTLSRPAEEIVLSEVVELFDSPPTGVFCPGGGECRDDDPCPAHRRWRLAVAAYVDFLECTTLAEIGRVPDALSRRLREGASG